RTNDGYAEVEFEDALTLRMGTNSTVELTNLALVSGGRVTQLNLSQGTAIVSTKLRRGDAVSLTVNKGALYAGAVNEGNAQTLTIQVPHDARFRADVDSSATPSESWITVFHGKVEVDSGSEKPVVLSSGHTLHENASGSISAEVAGSQPLDDFDKWVSQR